MRRHSLRCLRRRPSLSQVTILLEPEVHPQFDAPRLRRRRRLQIVRRHLVADVVEIIHVVQQVVRADPDLGAEPSVVVEGIPAAVVAASRPAWTTALPELRRGAAWQTAATRAASRPAAATTAAGDGTAAATPLAEREVAADAQPHVDALAPARGVASDA